MIKSIECKPDGEGKFNEFTYSKPDHMKYFLDKNYDMELYGYKVDPDDCSLKVYQDLLVFAFIKENIPSGSRMLDIGGGYSRVLKYYKDDYECWNIDKLEGLGNGPTEMNMEGIKLVLDYMGNFNKELPDNYFDFVFSISALEHVPEDDPTLFIKIFQDIDRVSKEGAYIFHAFDVVIKGDYVWTNKLMLHFFQNSKPLNDFIYLDKLKEASDIYVMAEKYYENNWRSSTNKSYEDFGKPLSYNILWKKDDGRLKFLEDTMEFVTRKQIPWSTLSKPQDYLKDNSAYVFHHIIKCGGSTVFNHLNKWFQVESDYRSYITPDEFLLFKDVNTYNKYKLNTENFTSDMCMVSHFDTMETYIHLRYPEVIQEKNKFKLFTFVREPLDLRISLYYFTFKGEDTKNLSLKDFLKSHSNLLSNQFPCDENNYKEVLDRYFFIGLVEKMQESFDKLGDLIGKKRIILSVDNKSDKDPQLEELKNDTDFVNEFRERNFLDYLVYNYSKEKYSKI